MDLVTVITATTAILSGAKAAEVILDNMVEAVMASEDEEEE